MVRSNISHRCTGGLCEVSQIHLYEKFLVRKVMQFSSTRQRGSEFCLAKQIPLHHQEGSLLHFLLAISNSCKNLSRNLLWFLQLLQRSWGVAAKPSKVKQHFLLFKMGCGGAILFVKQLQVRASLNLLLKQRIPLEDLHSPTMRYNHQNLKADINFILFLS